MRWGAFVLVSIFLFLLSIYGMVMLRETLLESKVPDHNPKLASRTVRNPQFMGNQFGFTSPPIYITSLKLYANFFIGLLMLLGIRTAMQRCCPSRFHAKQYNAFSDEKVEAGIGDTYTTVTDVEHYAGTLHAGHVLVGPRGEDGQVVYSLPFSEAISFVRPMLRVDFSGDVQNFIDKDKLMDDGIRSFTHSNMDEFRLENMRDLKELHTYRYVNTLRSKFLTDFKLTLLSLSFQLAGVLSTIYTLVEIYTQPIPLQACILLFNQHTASATLTVCVAQTLVMVRKARQDAGTKKKIAAWFLLILSVMIYLPTTLSALFIGWYGFLWYFFPSIPIGMGLLYVFGLFLARSNFASKTLFSWDGMIHTGPLTGRRKDDFLASEYDYRTPSSKAWFLITYYIPLQGAAYGCRMLIIVAYMLFGTLAAPLWWLVLCGFSNAWPVASAFMFEVILPLIFLLLLSVLVVARKIYNMNKAGVVMVLSFAMAQVCFSFMSVLLPASILLLDEDMQVESALPRAFAARQGSMYMNFLMKPISEAVLARSQQLSWWT